jgi:hypothetical protein
MDKTISFRKFKYNKMISLASMSGKKEEKNETVNLPAAKKVPPYRG